jgi:hypothetical protein
MLSCEKRVVAAFVATRLYDGEVEKSKELAMDMVFPVSVRIQRSEMETRAKAMLDSQVHVKGCYTTT